MKTFEFLKLRNFKADINETWSRYVPPQHLSLAKNEGVNEWAGEGRIQRKTKKFHEINISNLYLITLCKML